MTVIRRNEGREADIVRVFRAMWTNVTMISAWIVILFTGTRTCAH